MSVISLKTGFFLAYQLLDALYNEDEQHSKDSARTLCEWYMSNSETLNSVRELSGLRALLMQMHLRIIKGDNLSMREYNSLRAPIVDLLAQWVGKLKITLFLRQGIPLHETLCINDDIQPVTFGDYSGIPDTYENSVHMTLTKEPEDLDDAVGKVDINITSSEVYNRAICCFPRDVFDYDRMYLSSKLQCLSTSRNDTSIIIGGSSYAMAGLKEKLMPRPAVNLAVNAQDPYYTFLSIKTAIENCSSIDTVVIAGGYYFWYIDMSINPSDYFKSVLTRTNYPVLKDLHNYHGEILPAIMRSQTDPFLETVFDLRGIKEKVYDKASNGLTTLEYFNKEYNERSPYGMLNHDFHENSDEINEKVAATRAKAHNSFYGNNHLTENFSELSDFLQYLGKKNVKLTVVVPPATKFYRKYCEPGLRDTFYEMMETLQLSSKFTFLDLFDNPDFDVGDFQDYDHLNDAGAAKLSKMVAKMLNK